MVEKWDPVLGPRDPQNLTTPGAPGPRDTQDTQDTQELGIPGTLGTPRTPKTLRPRGTSATQDPWGILSTV